MIIDAHAHISDSNYGNLKLLIEQYDKANIDKGILVPGGMLDVRKMTSYISQKEMDKPMSNPPNHLVESAMCKYPERFYGFYCVNPNLGKSVLDEFENAVKYKNFVGLKLAPIVHKFSFDSEIISDLAYLCGQLNVSFYTHVLDKENASLNSLVKLIKAYPNTNFIIGHMGVGPADMEAIYIAKDNENMYLETSQGSYIIVKQALKIIGSSKIIFGSEFPLYHPECSLKNILVQDCSKSEFDNILSKNILGLIKK